MHVASRHVASRGYRLRTARLRELHNPRFQMCKGERERLSTLQGVLPVVLFASTLVPRPGATGVGAEPAPGSAALAPVLASSASLSSSRAAGLRFEANMGQLDPAVRYVSRAGRAVVFLTDDGAKMRFGGQAEGTELTMRVAGGRRVVPRGAELTATKASYFLGRKQVTDGGRHRHAHVERARALHRGLRARGASQALSRGGGAYAARGVRSKGDAEGDRQRRGRP